MKTLFTIIGLSVLTLSGCANVENFDNVRTARQPIVLATQSHLDLVFEYESSVLNSESRNLIEDFILRNDVDRYDEIYIDVAQAGGFVAQRRAETIAAYFKRFGLKAAFKQASGQDELQTVRVSLVNYQVNVPNCPDWSDEPGSSYNNQVHSNFGCAQAANLALMIGNPRDLVAPQELGYSDGTVLSNAISLYRMPRTDLNQTGAGQ